MDTKQIVTTATLKAAGDDEGTLEAVISTFDVVDRDGDIVLASAFQDGEEIPMVWSHDWHMPIGKGAIHVEPTRAVFKGRLNLKTDWGRNAYESIKDMGQLQQYSWGFQVLDADFAERDGAPVRIIKRTERFEASPVLVGAAGVGRTGTLDLKGAERLAFAEHLAYFTAGARTLDARIVARKEMRTKGGRDLSATDTDGLTAYRAALRDLVAHLDELVEAKGTADAGREVRALRIAALRRLTDIQLIAS